MELNGFDDLEDLKKQYRITDTDLEGYEILFAMYHQGAYDGSSIVVLKKNDALFIVDAGHCSCYGLENQFCPLETTKELLLNEATAKSRYSEYSNFVHFIRKYFT